MRALSRREFLRMTGLAGGSFALAACGGASGTGGAPAQDAQPEDDAPAAPPLAAAVSDLGNVAIVCFSWSGNTRSMASRIAELAGAEVFDLVPQEPYPEEYEACTDEALAEQRAGTLRAYQGDVDAWADVNTVFLGYPIWWMDLPQIVKAFIDDHDWSDKFVVPFSSYKSSGWAGTPDKVAETCAGSLLVEGISLAQDDLPAALDDIPDWYAAL